MPLKRSESRLISFRVSAEDHKALVTLSNVHRCSLSEFMRSSIHSLVLDSEVFLEILRPGIDAGARRSGQQLEEKSPQPILTLLVDLQQHARALETQVRRLAQALTGRLAMNQAGEPPFGRQRSE